MVHFLNFSSMITFFQLTTLITLKATAGGGGRGMRLAKEPDEFVKLLQVLINAIRLPAKIPYSGNLKF